MVWKYALFIKILNSAKFKCWWCHVLGFSAFFMKITYQKDVHLLFFEAEFVDKLYIIVWGRIKPLWYIVLCKRYTCLSHMCINVYLHGIFYRFISWYSTTVLYQRCQSKRWGATPMYLIRLYNTLTSVHCFHHSLKRFHDFKLWIIFFICDNEWCYIFFFRLFAEFYWSRRTWRIWALYV